MLKAKKTIKWVSLTLGGMALVILAIGVTANIVSPPSGYSSQTTSLVRGIKIVSEVHQDKMPTVTLTGATITDAPLQEVQSMAESGNREAQMILGALYWQGIGVSINGINFVPTDLSRSLHWYQKAAQQGAPEAHYYIGRAFEMGEGVSEDKRVARSWYEKGARLNHAPSISKIGYFINKGIGGLKANPVESANWFRRAAEMGDAIAQANYGVMLYHGIGVHQNLEQAVVWIRRSAEQGEAHGQFLLGNAYEHGEGVEKSMEQAISWYTEAENSGSAQAEKRLAELNDQTLVSAN
ncbi:MAG: sel1 repeat family protein [Candidatus Thiodiazotropha taylori]|nr:sel1 repeat family protein [Candidatus Thiodiazotropha taylori]